MSRTIDTYLGKKVAKDESPEEREAKAIWNWYKKASQELDSAKSRLSELFRTAPEGVLPLLNGDDSKAIKYITECLRYCSGAARYGWEMFVD